MDNPVTSCVICYESYDESARKPLLLPCNHSFCQSCLQAQEDSDDKRCALCKKGWDQSFVAALPTLYQLIPSGTSGQGKSRGEACRSHGDEITFWCESCCFPICNTCLDENHKKCEFMAIKKYRDREEDYAHVVNDLLENMSQNSARLDTLDCFGKELKKQREKHLIWKKISQRTYELLEDSIDKCRGALANGEFQEKRKGAQATYEKINGDVPTDSLLLQVARTYQETDERSIDKFIQNLRQSVGEETGESTIPTSTSETRPEEIVPPFQDRGIWMIRDTTACHKAIGILRNNTVRPSVVVVTGVHWSNDVLTELLPELSKIRCEVHVQFLDIFWNLGKESEEETQTRIENLLPPGYLCVVKRCWGHFTQEVVKKLPDTIDNVGFVLKEAEDVKALKALHEQAVARPIFGAVRKKWRNLTTLNLCFDKSFSNDNGMLDDLWNADARKLISSCAALNIHISLHVPRLESADLVWMRDIVVKVTQNFSHRQSVKFINLPGTSLTADDLLDLLKDCELRCQVHFPSYQLQDPETIESYASIGCSVIWDLEAIFSIKRQCVVM